MDQVLAQLDLLRNLFAPGLQERRLPEKHEKKMGTLPSRAQRVCLLPNELDEKVAKLHFLTLFSLRAGVRDDSGMSLLMRAQFGWARVRDDFASARWLHRGPEERCAKQGRLLKQRHRSRKRRRRKDSPA